MCLMCKSKCIQGVFIALYSFLCTFKILRYQLGTENVKIFTFKRIRTIQCAILHHQILCHSVYTRCIHIIIQAPWCFIFLFEYSNCCYNCLEKFISIIFVCNKSFQYFIYIYRNFVHTFCTYWRVFRKCRVFNI